MADYPGIYPRPHKWVIEDGKRRKAPVKKGESYQLPDGEWKVATSDSTWTWELTVGTRAEGTRRTFSKGGYPTQAAARKARTSVQARHDDGDDRWQQKPTTTPLGRYLNTWLDERAAVPPDDENHIKPSTVQGYRDAIRAWVAPSDEEGRWVPLPRLGAVELRRVSHDHLLELYTDLRKRGKRCRRCQGAGRLSFQRPGIDVCPACEGVGGKPLGSRSVQLCHVILRMALAEAVEAGKLPRSPVERMPKKKRPKHKAKQAVDSDDYWEPIEAQRFLAATRDQRLGPLWALALDSGARRGELDGLAWPDVDLDAATITLRANRVLVDGDVIEGTVKGKAKSRTIDIDPRTITALKRWRSTQAQERLAAGEAWTGADKPTDGYVWTDELGEVYRPDTMARRFEQSLPGIDVKPLHFHWLRHTSATLAIADGVPIHVVSKRLGHADVKITLQVYVHVIDKQRTEAATRIGDQLYGEATGTEGGS